ncbi:hypothetical protein FJ987_06405 [Mesorhizobium sp. CU2]|uniref:hypothetical protein n=1 Tax=unclassified Mesorhizobium TaxID=325217 RepID=UPI00112EED81|nr:MULTISPECIES: hypothetical protein [unclassified Mesorhizobium]TPN86466.1 hypothetical protein FJ988_06670 [Mesorhizobium sp. CU3]TPO19903.1 hypothetical protein FJ987_06405 [Mesorhizobium sp. CU2]
MPKFSCRAGLILGLCTTPFALLLALFSAGSGHGDWVLARVLYPIPMLVTLLTNNTVTSLSVGLAVVQFPAYGVFVALGGRGRWLALGVVHAIAVLAAFSGVLDYFEG